MYLTKSSASKLLPDDLELPSVNPFMNLKKKSAASLSQDHKSHLKLIRSFERKFEEDEILEKLIREHENLENKTEEMDEKLEILREWMKPHVVKLERHPFNSGYNKSANLRKEALKKGMQPFSSLAAWERAEKLSDFTEHRLGPKYSRMVESKNHLNEFVKNQFQKIEAKTNYYQKWREEMQVKKLEEIARKKKEKEAEEQEKIRRIEEVKRKRAEKLNQIVNMTMTLKEINRMESGDGPRSYSNSKSLPYALKFDWDRTLNFEADFEIEKKKNEEKFELAGVTSLKESKYQPRLSTPTFDFRIHKLKFYERLYTFDLRPGKMITVYNKLAEEESNGEKIVSQLWPNRGVYEVDGIKIVISNTQALKRVSVRINISKFIRESVKVAILRPGRMRFVSKYTNQNDEYFALDFLVSRTLKDKHINPTINRFDMFTFEAPCEFI